MDNIFIETVDYFQLIEPPNLWKKALGSFQLFIECQKDEVYHEKTKTGLALPISASLVVKAKDNTTVRI